MKTAELFEASCTLGAELSGGPAEYAKAAGALMANISALHIKFSTTSPDFLCWQ